VVCGLWCVVCGVWCVVCGVCGEVREVREVKVIGSHRALSINQGAMPMFTSLLRIFPAGVASIDMLNTTQMAQLKISSNSGPIVSTPIITGLSMATMPCLITITSRAMGY